MKNFLFLVLMLGVVAYVGSCVVRDGPEAWRLVNGTKDDFTQTLVAPPVDNWKDSTHVLIYSTFDGPSASAISSSAKLEIGYVCTKGEVDYRFVRGDVGNIPNSDGYLFLLVNNSPNFRTTFVSASYDSTNRFYFLPTVEGTREFDSLFVNGSSMTFGWEYLLVHHYYKISSSRALSEFKEAFGNWCTRQQP